MGSLRKLLGRATESDNPYEMIEPTKEGEVLIRCLWKKITGFPFLLLLFSFSSGFFLSSLRFSPGCGQAFTSPLDVGKPSHPGEFKGRKVYPQNFKGRQVYPRFLKVERFTPEILKVEKFTPQKF